MIATIIRILGQDEFYNISERVETAKGKYEKITGVRQAYKQIKRVAKYERGILKG